MNNASRMAVAAAAVVAVAVVGFNLMPRASNAVPGSSATPAPTPSPSPSLLPATGALDPGVYYTPVGPDDSARFSFAVPAGWSIKDGVIYKDRGSVAPVFAPGAGPGDVAFFTWVVTHIYGDACHWQGSLVDAGSTVDELVSVLRAQKGRVASTPTDDVLGGLTAKRIELTTPSDLDLSTCDRSVVSFWPDPGPDVTGGLCCSPVGSTDVVYVVNVAGSRLVIVARHQADSTAPDIAELEAAVASIKLDAQASSPSPSGTSPSP